jgi:ABC-2 type transport system ATP-binding protein
VTEQLLEIDRVSKRYGRVLAVDDVSFEVRSGEVFGFVGPNGAGKTTTMRVVLGVLAADAGEVRWAGSPITFDTRRRIGYMPEERGLYPTMGVAEQLVYLARLHGMTGVAARRSARDWLERFGLADRGAEKLQKLSMGNQQRVQLAAALVFEPEALILDEPFSGLDPVAVDLMTAVLRERAEAGVSVVFSSHQLELVERLSDRVGIVRAGHMVASGTVDELRATAARRVWVDAPLAGTDWASELTGVKPVRAEGTRMLLELGEGADDQAVLAAALRTGPVHEFRPDRPSLAELFRHVVTEEVAE